MIDSTPAVRELNDRFRATFVGGRVVVTPGVHALEADVKRRLLAKIQSFDAFAPENDPYGEHDFGAVELDGERFLFKIDYFDPLLQSQSIDTADPMMTTRVLTIMRADEY